jgi:hypothetical protein
MKADFSLFTAAAREFVSAARAVGTSAVPRTVAPDLAPARAHTALELAALDSSLPANGAEPVASPAFTPADVQLFEQVEQLRAADLAQALMVERLRKQQKVDPERSLRAKVTPASTAAMRFQPPVSERAAAEEVEEKPEPLAARIWDVLWPLRNLIVGALVLAAVASVYGYVRPAPGATKEKVALVNLGERVFTDDWVIVANSVDRVGALGPVPPRNGVYLVVRITVTKKSDSAVILEPTDFALLDQAGLLTPAQEPTSSVYSTAESNTQLGWSQSYPAGIPVRDPLVFDVSQTARDLELLIHGSTVRIRLPN